MHRRSAHSIDIRSFKSCRRNIWDKVQDSSLRQRATKLRPKIQIQIATNFISKMPVTKLQESINHPFLGNERQESEEETKLRNTHAHHHQQRKNYVFITFLYHADWHVTRKDSCFFAILFVCFDFLYHFSTRYTQFAGALSLCVFVCAGLAVWCGGCFCRLVFRKMLSPENKCMHSVCNALIYVLMYKKICISKEAFVCFSSSSPPVVSHHALLFWLQY